jgi:hypothetical protein
MGSCCHTQPGQQRENGCTRAAGAGPLWVTATMAAMNARTRAPFLAYSTMASTAQLLLRGLPSTVCMWGWLRRLQVHYDTGMVLHGVRCACGRALPLGCVLLRLGGWAQAASHHSVGVAENEQTYIDRSRSVAAV